MIVFGVRRYGRVDETPVGHVATRFVHVWFLPLVPLSSHFVTSEDGNSFQGRPMPMSLRSVFVGYARGFGVLLALGCGLGFLYHLVFRFYGDLEIFLRGGAAVTIGRMIETTIELALLGVGAVAGGIALFVASRFRRASPARCAELSRALGIAIPPTTP